jgi:ABC-type nickel/cobalt efflux system permease component RcnA
MLTLSLRVLLVLTFIAGVVLMAMIVVDPAFQVRRLKTELRQAQNEINELKSEVEIQKGFIGLIVEAMKVNEKVWPTGSWPDQTIKDIEKLRKQLNEQKR